MHSLQASDNAWSNTRRNSWVDCRKCEAIHSTLLLDSEPWLITKAQIRRNSDIKSLCEVSKSISTIVTPLLYEFITLHEDDKLDLEGLKHKIECCTGENTKFTRNICLKAPFHYNIRKRCPHHHPCIPERLGDAVNANDKSEVCLPLSVIFYSSLEKLKNSF